MYTLISKVNFYDKAHPGRMVHPGEAVTTEDVARAKHLVELGFVEKIEFPEDEAAKVAPETAPQAANEADENEAPAAKVVNVGGSDYELAKVRDSLNAIGVKTASNAGVEAVAKKVSELSEDEAARLSEELTK